MVTRSQLAPEAELGEFGRADDMSKLLRLLPALGVQPGWAKTEPSLWPQPRKTFLPAHWAFESARAALEATGRLVSAERAERRNLILANPLAGNVYATVRTLVAAYQMVKGGETAPSHRHTPNALRLIVESDADAFTVVNGKRVPMEPGDIVLTPSWQWHGHQNLSKRNAYWIDFLDVPTVQFLEPMFLENHPSGIEEAHPLESKSQLRLSRDEIATALDNATSCAGFKELHLDTPVLRTMGLDVCRLDDGAEVHLSRRTSNRIYAVMSGRGHALVEGLSIDLAPGDVLALPAWRRVVLTGVDGLNLLCVSDEPMMDALGWLRIESDKAVRNAVG